MYQKVRKAVIPAAGYGTRMLPITKTTPKEMLPLVNKPIIQVVVEELVEAGIEDIIIITSPHKSALVDYFGDIDPGLVKHLWDNKKTKQLSELDDVKGLANIAFVEQHGVYGTGTPVLNAEPYLGDEPFIYTFADDFFVAEQNSFSQLIETYERYGTPVIACQSRTVDADYDRYGYVGGEELEAGVVSLDAPIAEHPGKAHAPGDLASLGGFIVTPETLAYLHLAAEQLAPGHELYFHTALSLMLADGKQVVAREVKDALYFDTGNMLEYVKTCVAMAARHPEIGADFKAFLKEFNP